MKYRYRYRRNSSRGLGFFGGIIVFLVVINLIRFVIIAFTELLTGFWQKFLLSAGFSSKSWPVQHPYQSSFYTTILLIIFVVGIVKYLSFKRKQKRSVFGLEEKFLNSHDNDTNYRNVMNEVINLIKYEFNEYEDNHGYIKVFVPKYKHRMTAEKILQRNLYPNEVVHHIDGSKRNNEPSNLCVMDRDKHEHFHAWMNWKKDKEGAYPDIDLLKRELEGEVYQGILLAEFN